MPKKFLSAEWNNLIMANYVIDPAVLQNYLPPKTELDLFEGKCLVSLIGFMFEETAILGFRIPFHINFEEVNLRFYVRYLDNGTWKRGAVFIKEIVPRRAITFIANTLYNEKYITLPMKHHYEDRDDEISLGYQWKFRGVWNRLEAVTDKQHGPMLQGSKEEFITEHYWGYSRYNALTTFEYPVEHPRWNIYPVRSYNIECDFSGLYGLSFAFMKTATPDSVFVAQGSPITIFDKRRL